ncbi:MAG: monofunctional biosynthetic peptidoglycan transglycosylase [Ignavibacteria bacterium RBG_13_36_8]|nr:MAG: monofunctional biosynthetic peptidoglycan transglycosylase [Ignavibacteria bacterium RBG_13_36_8]
MSEKKSWRKRLVVIIVKGIAYLFAFTLLIVLPWRWINPPTTSFILQVKFSSAKDAPKEIKQEWVSWVEISPNMPIAVVAAEDQNFPTHFGFDLESISKALNRKSRRVRGASTITQQVVKNLYLWPSKSFIRKGIEAYLTFFIEAFWPKQRILEVYLNVAEFGRGVYGVEAASKTYFRRSASNLTLYQASLLAAVLPSPRRRSPSSPSAYVQNRAEWIIQQVNQLGGAEYLKDL